MTDVVVPGVGTVSFPDGMSQAEMAAAIQKNFPQIHAARSTAAPEGPSIGPAPDDLGAMRRMYEQSAADAEAGNEEFGGQRGSFFGLKMPFSLQSESFHEKSIPVLGGMAGMLVPGAGWSALGLQSLFSGAGAGIGELFRQKQTREPIQPKKAAKEGVVVGAGTLAAGTVVKGLGAVAKKIFSSPLSGPQQAAATFAKEQGSPFPLSSAAPGSGAARTQTAARGLLPGEIRTQVDANKVTQFLNTRVGTMTEKAAVFDDAAKNGQQFLREVFEPGEVVIRNTFKEYAAAVGDDVAIPTTNTLAAVQAAADQLANRGQTTGGLYQRLRTILKRNPATFTPKEFDELYGGIISQAFTSKAKAGGEGRVLLEAITRDMDEFGKPAGVNFSEAILKATATREQYRELRNIPQLERLAGEFKTREGAKGSIDWMNSLFSSGNGKALAKMRELNPELYHELADAYLAKQIDGFSKFSPEMMGRTLDGAGMRSWFVQNQPKIKEIYGAPQAKALDNFTLYAEMMTGAMQRSAKGSKGLEAIPLMTRAGGEAAGVVKAPWIMIPGEAASYVLAKGLSDPSSSLFKVFTQGFSPTTRSFMIKSAGLAGQAGARKVEKENGEDTR